MRKTSNSMEIYFKKQVKQFISMKILKVKFKIVE